MELQTIKQLIDVLAASDLAEIELVEGDHRVRLVRRVGSGAPAPSAAPAPARMAPAPPGAAAPGVAGGAAPQESAELVGAPLYGVLHLTPSPDAPAFVRVGDAVQAGQTLCVVEAMKMFHEVKARRSGRIAAILAAAGDEVQAGAALFRLVATDDA